MLPRPSSLAPEQHLRSAKGQASAQENGRALGQAFAGLGPFDRATTVLE
jgi:hypothetical protein